MALMNGEVGGAAVMVVGSDVLMHPPMRMTALAHHRQHARTHAWLAK